MLPEQFCYWLNGFSELTEGGIPSAQQWQMIQDHLKTVFIKVTPRLDEYPRSPVVPMTPYPSTPVIPMTPPQWQWPYKPLEITCQNNSNIVAMGPAVAYNTAENGSKLSDMKFC